MLQDIESPSNVMYSCLKQYGGIKNNELARIIYSENFTYGGSSILDRLGDRSFVSRSLARAMPGDFPEGAYRPFSESAQIVYSMLVSKNPGLAGKTDIIQYFTGEACDKMCQSLKDLGLNNALYRNLTKRLEKMDRIGVGDKAMLLILQFIATGALGNPSRASRITQDFALRIASSGFTTDVVIGDPTTIEMPAPSSIQLGLCRIIDGKLRMPAYVLSTDEAGTEIGSLSTAENAINDVGSGVSRRHLRVFRDNKGRWFAQGLGSTNGSTVIRSSTGDEEPIELPKRERNPRDTPPCVQIFANDTLCLTNSTRFAVLELV